jgi:hypothetical protein
MKRSASWMCWRGVCRASFQTQSALGAPTRPSSGVLLPTNCRCRKRRLGSTTSVPVARAFRISTSSAKKRQANGVVSKFGWPLLRFCYSRSADCCGCEVGPCRTHPMLLCWTFVTGQWLAGKTHLRLASHLWRFLEPLSTWFLICRLGAKKDPTMSAYSRRRATRFCARQARRSCRITLPVCGSMLISVVFGRAHILLGFDSLVLSGSDIPSGCFDPLTPRSGEQKPAIFITSGLPVIGGRRNERFLQADLWGVISPKPVSGPLSR